MPTDELTKARRRIADIGLADAVFTAVAAHRTPPHLTDDDAPTVWNDVSARFTAVEAGRYCSSADVGLIDLHARLTGLLTRVRASPSTAPMTDLVDRYRRIRDAQKALVFTATRGVAGSVEIRQAGVNIIAARLLQVTGAMSNIDEVWPEWHQHFSHASGAQPPWEHTSAEPFTVSATAANLRLLATGPARPWVPTLDQMKAAYVEQTAAEADRRRVANETRVYGSATQRRDAR